MNAIRRNAWVKGLLGAVCLVAAVNVCCGGGKGHAKGQALASPTCLTAAPVTFERIDLAWEDRSTGEEGFLVERKAKGRGAFEVVATVGADATAYADTGRAPATAYFYKVRAYRNGKRGGSSNMARARTPTDTPVVSIDPPPGAVDVPLDGGVVVNFTEPMDRPSVEAAFSMEDEWSSPVQGTFSWNSPMTFAPVSNLAAATLHNITITTNARFATGAMVSSNIVWSFMSAATVTIAPVILSTDPTNNAQQVDVATAIDVTFSTAMNTSATEAAFSIMPAVSGAFSWSTNTMHFAPASNLAYSTTYTCTVSTAAVSLVGMQMTSAHQWSFMTRSPPTGPIYRWTRALGGSGAVQKVLAYGVAATPTGGVYVVGDFDGTVDFGTDFATNDPRTAAGGSDVFLTRINPDGTYGWTRTIGGGGSDRGWSVTRDSLGNLYLCGVFAGSVNFGADFGATDSWTALGGWDIFLTKVNADGTYGWTAAMGGGGNDTGLAVTCDPWDNVYLAGNFRNNVNFGAAFSTNDWKSAVPGDWDLFVSKVNANGTYGWTRKIGGALGGETANAMTTDAAGNVYLTGEVWATLDFSTDFPGAPPDWKTFLGGTDAFVTRINANGTYGWTRMIAGTQHENGNALTTDGTDVYVAGMYLGTVDFRGDFGSPLDSRTALGQYDLFVTKILANGNYGWTKAAGGAVGHDRAYGATADGSGHVYVTGDFAGTVDFGADFPVTDSKTVVGKSDAFVMKISSGGGYGWTRTCGGAGFDATMAVTFDGTQSVYCAGSFQATNDFGAAFGTNDAKIAAGLEDAFVTRFDP